MRIKRKILAGTLLAGVFAAGAANAGNVRVTVTNNAGPGGTYLTPV